MEELEDAPRREIVGWVRPSRHKKKESSTQKVLLRGAAFELGDMLGGSRRKRRERVWRSSIAMEELPPPAPSPPLASTYGYPGHYQQYQQYPQGYGHPGNVTPQYPAPYQQQQMYGAQAYFQGQATPVVYPTQAAPHVLRHQVAYDQLSRLQIEHQNLAEPVKKEARRHRKVEAKQALVLESVVQEKDSVEAQNKDLKKKLKRQSKQIEEEQRRGRSRRRSEVEIDELVRGRLSHAQRVYEEDQLNQHLAEIQAREYQYGYRDYRDRDKERELKKKLEKQREKAREQEAKIAELKREQSRIRLKQSREQKTAAWAEEQKRAERDRLYMEDLHLREHAADYAAPSAYDFYRQDHFRPRRSQSQSNRYAPPTAYAYQSPGRLRSYSVDARQPLPPPIRHESRYPPPPALQLRSSLYAVKPHRSNSVNGSSHSSGIGDSSTSTSRRQHRKGNSSESTLEASTAISSVSSRMGRSFSLSEARGEKRKDYSKFKKASVETDHEDERDARRRSRSKGKQDGKEDKKKDQKKSHGEGKVRYS